MSTEEYSRHPNSRKVLNALAEARFASRLRGAPGRPRVSHFDRALKKSVGYLSRILRGEIVLDIDTLFRCLDLFGVSPRKFFAAVFGSAKPDVEILLRELETPGTGEGEFLVQIEEWASDIQAFDGNANAEPLPAADETLEHELRAVVSGLDELRFGDLSEARQRVIAVIESLLERFPANKEVICRCLGVLGSVYRMESQFAASARALRIALQLARANSFDSAEANILQRAASLIGDQGDYEAAADIALKALETSVLLEERKEIGRTLVVRAIMLNRMGNSLGAIKLYQSALQYLPTEALLTRFGAYQGLGFACCAVGDLERAEEFANKALAIQPGLPIGERRVAAFLEWLRGEIALKKGDFERAEKVFRKVSETLSEVGQPVDVAVVCLERARALFHQGRLAEIKELAKEVARLLSPLRGNRIAAAAVSEFARGALTGEITARLLDRLCAKARNGCPPGHPLRI